MANTDQGEDNSVVVSVTKREKQAEHWLVDAAGNTVEDEELATGIGYKLVALPNDPVVWQIPDKAKLMLACFAAKTLATNESSQVRNNPKGAGTAQEQIDAVRERFALLETGVFIDRTREGVGARVDKGALAQAIKQAEPGLARTEAEVLAKLESDPAYLRAARQVPEVANAYAAIVGRPTKTTADLAF